MAAFVVAHSPRSASPTAPDCHPKEAPSPPPLTVNVPRAATSPFPSPSSSFVPPPMPGAHEFANRPHPARFPRRKKSNGSPTVAIESGVPGPSKKDSVQVEVNSKEPNGIVPPLDVQSTNANSCSRAEAVTNACSPTSVSLSLTPTSRSPSDDAGGSPFEAKAVPGSASPALLSEPVETAPGGRNTPTQMHITLPSPPPSPSQLLNISAAPVRTPSGSGTASKHTSLSSSRPAPASPSPAPSRRQSGAPSLHSHHRSGISVTSTSPPPKFGTIKSPLPVPQRRKGEIKIRDFAFPGGDARHIGRGPDAPRIIKKLLNQHGPLDAGSRRESGMSESSVDSEASSRRSSGFANWSGFRWASKLSGAWGFGGGTTKSLSGIGSSNGGVGYTPSQQDFERNFDDTADPDALVDSPGDDGEYLSDYDNYGDGDGEPEELLPGLYRALYDFDPEGTAEMGLKEGQVIRVVGRGGGVGWAIAVRPDAEAPTTGDAESNWALVPESYLRVVKLDEPEPEIEGAISPDDTEQDIIKVGES